MSLVARLIRRHIRSLTLFFLNSEIASGVVVCLRYGSVLKPMHTWIKTVVHFPERQLHMLSLDRQFSFENGKVERQSLCRAVQSSDNVPAEVVPADVDDYKRFPEEDAALTKNMGEVNVQLRSAWTDSSVCR